LARNDDLEPLFSAIHPWNIGNSPIVAWRPQAMGKFRATAKSSQIATSLFAIRDDRRDQAR
jgi:hypothetical protein